MRRKKKITRSDRPIGERCERKSMKMRYEKSLKKSRRREERSELEGQSKGSNF